MGWKMWVSCWYSRPLRARVMAVRTTRKVAGFDVEGVLMYTQLLEWQFLLVELLRNFLLYFSAVLSVFYYIIRHFCNNPQEITYTSLERKRGACGCVGSQYVMRIFISKWNEGPTKFSELARNNKRFKG